MVIRQGDLFWIALDPSDPGTFCRHGVGDMQLLETLTIPHGAASRLIELYHGDLTELLPQEAVDLLS